jgi:protein gp37
MNATRIEWATMTWNPITGCSPISEGCQNCYAARMAHRLAGRCGYDKDKPFGPTLHADKLDDPRCIRNPQRIFVCSMGDLFHEDVPVEWINEVLFVMLASQRHRFLVLTKRPERMKEYFQQHPNYINVWLGVTAENQARADERIPVLLSIPAAGHFVSVEPMLGPVRVMNLGTRNRVNWVICGAETGPGKRAIQQKWVHDLERQCEMADIPFFGKKWSDGFPMSRREIPQGLEVER